ncbi:MAG: META domain-containing protein [Pseudomonadales bacterium]|nr:META domain-containing protein [Pseudomonadales bacterium]
MKQYTLLLLSALLVPLTGCEDEDKLFLTEHEKNKATWQAAAIDDYRYTFNRSCFCPLLEDVVVTVIDGEIREASYTPSGEVLDATAIAEQYTLDNLFTLVEQDIPEGESIEVVYHSTLGFPEEIHQNLDQAAVDGSVSFYAKDFQTITDNTAQFIWGADSIKITIQETGGLAGVSNSYSYEAGEINLGALSLLKSIQVDNTDPACWEDAFNYVVTVMDSSDVTLSYYDNVNVCNGNTADKNYIDAEEILSLITALKQPALAGQYWQLKSYSQAMDDNATQVMGNVDYAFEFDGKDMRGMLDCNNFSAAVTVLGNSIKTAALTTTEMYCAEADKAFYGPQHTLIKNVLEAASEYKINEGVLTITALDGAQLYFHTVAPIELSLIELHKGDQYYDGSIAKTSYKTFRSATAYNQDLSIYSNETAKLLDFTQGQVVRVDRGMVLNSGFYIQVSKVMESANALLVTVDLTDMGDGCMVTEALRNPYQYIWVESLKTVHFKEEKHVMDCATE